MRPTAHRHNLISTAKCNPFKFVRETQPPTSQLDSRFKAQVLLKAGSQTIELAQTDTGPRVCVTNGTLSDWIHFYKANWFCDGVFPFNQQVKRHLSLIAKARAQA